MKVNKKIFFKMGSDDNLVGFLIVGFSLVCLGVIELAHEARLDRLEKVVSLLMDQTGTADQIIKVYPQFFK